MWAILSIPYWVHPITTNVLHLTCGFLRLSIESKLSKNKKVYNLKIKTNIVLRILPYMSYVSNIIQKKGNIYVLLDFIYRSSEIWDLKTWNLTSVISYVVPWLLHAELQVLLVWSEPEGVVPWMTTGDSLQQTSMLNCPTSLQKLAYLQQSRKNSFGLHS